MNLFSGTVLALYLGVLMLVCAYGLHRYSLVYLYYKHKNQVPRVGACFRELPAVTIQLPMFNERLVARRVIEHACGIDYPADKLQIQVLDDSTDDTADIVRRTVADMQAAGHNVELRQRSHRQGYKAGALQDGLATASGEFICIFDADFIPTREVLAQTIHYFTDPQVGMVQVRWGHVNREQSLLTQTQAVLLDGHFVVEHGARNRAGRFMNFNGTAGVWRRRCIADAGGWQHDTLTEDLDLSYRAQLSGWRFLFVPGTAVPAELPPEMEAFKAQQYRWTKGGAQTCRKLLPRILASKLPWPVKLEAFWHLTGNMVYGYVVLLTVLLFPALYLKVHLFSQNAAARLVFDMSLLTLATFSASTFYVCSQRELNRSWWDSVKYLPAVMGLGIGIALNNTRAMLQGFFGKPSEFVRTPKYGVAAGGLAAKPSGAGYQIRPDFKLQPWLELLMGLYMTACLGMVLAVEHLSLGAPFLFLFAAGYLYVSLSSLLGPWWRQRHQPIEAAVLPAS